MKGELSRCLWARTARSCPTFISVRFGATASADDFPSSVLPPHRGYDLHSFSSSYTPRLPVHQRQSYGTAVIRRCFSGPTPSLAVEALSCAVPAVLCLQCCRSHISSFKEEGYYRLAQLRDIQIDENCYTLRMARGGGPGGQGANSSSNKVELRASVVALSEHFDEELIHRLKDNEHGKALTADGAILVISSHEHRSAHQNKEACLRRLREMIQKASWVPPVEAGSIKRPTTIITAHKVERRKKGSLRKMQQTARKGLW
ncbi:ribosome-associated protein [Trypanosoma rangeli]|uniref:Ribosome-associated protein n=1 Tax=Trypanosoma rangeli TaxID=5698 RepID=A0A422P522_TRYRA|nr:ribosome-associated protein [Trypanosoma rangeli]RNF12764.1 ribosome-associated protein [Trypanosoma rangeli]|eukprot:RNF12764.1 ribosome-associated protein [Trypanosoma rangeli]